MSIGTLAATELSALDVAMTVCSAAEVFRIPKHFRSSSTGRHWQPATVLE